jgi:amino acid transporter
MRRLPRMRWAYLAAALALASAAVSLYWGVGGTALLATVGGEIEELARERSTATVATLGVVVIAKLFGAVLALYGGVLVVAGALVLAGVIDASDDTDEYALRWHAFCWDLWFVVWGVSLWIAARESGSLGSGR